MKIPPRPARRFAIRYGLIGSARSENTRWSTVDRAEAEAIAAWFNNRFPFIDHAVVGFVVAAGKRVYQEG